MTTAPATATPAHAPAHAPALDPSAAEPGEPAWRRFVRPPFYAPVINATCHWTAYGGTVMWPEVSEAMAEARRACVDIRALLDAAGEAISGHTHAEASHVLSGCAAALMAGAAAMLTGDDPRLMAALPHTAGLQRNEFVTRRFSRRRTAGGEEYGAWGYAHAVRAAGGVFAEVGEADGGAGVTREAFEAAFGERTAGVYWVSDGVAPGIGLEEVIAIAHGHGVPVLLDASNTLPPPEHLYRFVDLGADLVAFSGGKGLRGPQGSGILTGRATLIRSARLQSAPVQGVGRGLKVSKEEIVGLLTALEVWAARDHEADLRDAQRRTMELVDALAGLPGAQAQYRFPDHLGRPYPTAFVALDPAAGLTAAGAIERLLTGAPAVAVMSSDDPYVLRIDVRVLGDEDAARVAGAVRAALSRPASSS